MTSSDQERPRLESRPPSRVPELAIVPKREEQGGLLGDEGPLRITPSARAQSKTKLREMGERVRSGNGAGLDALRHGGFGRTSRGQTACEHYLPANRFEWWDLDEDGKTPPTGPIGPIGADPAAVYQIFYSEFCSPLSTVVGADLTEVASVGASTAVSWDVLADGASPNNLSSVEFAVRTLRPASVPVIREVEVILRPGQRVLRKVLINGVEAGHELDPGKTRPSLFVDFFAAQRAVGLECGFLGERGREINPRSVRLIARDSTGEVLVESRGSELFPVPWGATAVFYFIGVRHQGGAIRSVELRFEDSDAVILEPQIVYRIWYEPLPSAAVAQGTAAVEFDPNPPGSEDDNVIRVPPHDGPLGPFTVKLPFRCDRAVAMMRGFKMFFLDQRPHEVEALDAFISGPPFGDPRHAGIFEAEPGGRITLVPHGHLTSGDAAPYRVLIYYLVLAWNSEQMELMPIGGFQGDNRETPGLASSQITVQDPCPPSRAECVFPGSILGPLSANLQGFSFLARPAQEVDLVGLHMGRVGGGQCREGRHRLGSGINVLPAGPPALGRSDGTIAWEFCTFFNGVDQSFRAAQGTILVGRSVVGDASDIPTIIFEAVGPRDPNTPFAFIFDQPDFLAQPISADMAFLSLGYFVFEPKGKIRELETEVHGLEYDGALVKWELGIGVSASPVVTNDGKRTAWGWPVFGGVVRRAAAAITQLAVQNLRFDNAIRGALSLQPDQYGALRNTGNVPILLSRADRGGSQAGEFNFLLDFRGDVFLELELVDRAPLVLAPGETLVIGGRFFPQAEAGPNDPPRTAWVEFETNASQFPVVHVEATGRTVPEQARGAMLPEVIDFSFVNIDASNHPLGFPTKNVLLISSGQTPLLIQSLDLDDPSLGFSFGIRDPGRLEAVRVTPGVRYQVQEGDTMVLEVRFVPVDVGPVDTKLVALTNAGRLEARLLGDGVH